MGLFGMVSGPGNALENQVIPMDPHENSAAALQDQPELGEREQLFLFLFSNGVT
jgi:hypothetical protein